MIARYCASALKNGCARNHTGTSLKRSRQCFFDRTSSSNMGLQQQQRRHSSSIVKYSMLLKSRVAARTNTALMCTAVGTVGAGAAFVYNKQHHYQSYSDDDSFSAFLFTLSRIMGTKIPKTMAEGKQKEDIFGGSKDAHDVSGDDESHDAVVSKNQSRTMTSPSRSSVDLIIPTLEASLRAWRLCATAFLMVMDYEIAKLEDTYPIVHSLLVENTNDDTDENDNKSNNRERRKELQNQVHELQKQLEKCQIAYTAPLCSKDVPNQEERQQIKQQQKQDMHQTAEDLCHAQQELRHCGGDRRSAIHTKAATRLLNLCRLNGGVYIKVGQHLANLDYLIPQEYIDVLHSLFDDAPVTSYDDVCQVIQEDLNIEHPLDIFDTFERTPIASASLAQVHVATCKSTGKRLAVKVQHRGLRETSAGDLFAVTSVIRIIEWLFPKDFTFGWIADEIAPQLPKELDFCNEGRNAEKAAAHISKLGMDEYCIIPKVNWDHTSQRVLCMDFEEGFKSTDMDAIEKANFKKRDVAKLISSIFNAQIFLGGGWVHCDPHPANVMLRPHPKYKHKPVMVLVDHGLYKQLDDDFRLRYATLWKSLMLADLEGIKDACASLNVNNEFYQLLSGILTSRPFDEMVERSKTGSLTTTAAAASLKSSSSSNEKNGNGSSSKEADKAVISGYAQQYMAEIFDILGTLPRQMLLLLKMNDCLRHIDYALGSPTNTLVVAGTYASRALYEQQQTNLNMNLSGTGSDGNAKISLLVSSMHSLSKRWKVWIEHMRVLFRIGLYDISVWLMDEVGFAFIQV